MASYLLSKEAENDLRDIAKYTLDKWGKEQLTRYRQNLKLKFVAIANDNVERRKFSNKLPHVNVTKAGSHFVFYLTPKESVPIIIGVIHEKRDLVKQLTSRLSP